MTASHDASDTSTGLPPPPGSAAELTTMSRPPNASTPSATQRAFFVFLGEISDRDDALATGRVDQSERGLGTFRRDVGDDDPRALCREQHRDGLSDPE